jgi:predicted HTH domain antitoxin
MTITVPDDVLTGRNVPESELRLELAVALFQREKLTLAQGSRLAGVSRLQFQHALAARGMEVHFTLDDWQDDVHTLDSRRQA